MYCSMIFVQYIGCPPTCQMELLSFPPLYQWECKLSPQLIKNFKSLPHSPQSISSFTSCTHKAYWEIQVFILTCLVYKFHVESFILRPAIFPLIAFPFILASQLIYLSTSLQMHPACYLSPSFFSSCEFVFTCSSYFHILLYSFLFCCRWPDQTRINQRLADNHVTCVYGSADKQNAFHW